MRAPSNPVRLFFRLFLGPECFPANASWLGHRVLGKMRFYLGNCHALARSRVAEHFELKIRAGKQPGNLVLVLGANLGPVDPADPVPHREPAVLARCATRVDAEDHEPKLRRLGVRKPDTLHLNPEVLGTGPAEFDEEGLLGLRDILRLSLTMAMDAMFRASRSAQQEQGTEGGREGKKRGEKSEDSGAKNVIHWPRQRFVDNERQHSLQ